MDGMLVDVVVGWAANSDWPDAMVADGGQHHHWHLVGRRRI
jgi:hypothetical protein